MLLDERAGTAAAAAPLTPTEVVGGECGFWYLFWGGLCTVKQIKIIG